MKRERLITCLTGFVLAFLVGFSAIACMVTAFDMETVSLGTLALRCLLTAGVCVLCYGWKLGLVPLGAMAVYLGYLWQKGILLDSIESLLYEITLVCHKAYGWDIIRWSYRTGDVLATTLPPVVYLMGMGLTLVVAWSVCRRQSAIPAILAALPGPLCCLVVTDKVPHGLWVAVLLYGIAMLMLTSTARQDSEKQGNKLTVYSALPMALAIAILFGCIPQKGYDGSQRAQDISDVLLTNSALRDFWEELTGQSLTTVSTVDGNKVDLTTVGNRSSSASEVLWITSNYSGTVYLRSRALDTYDGTSWTDSGDGTDLYWPGKGDVDPVGEMVISTRYAHRMLYLPYYVTSMDMTGVARGIENETQMTSYSIACGEVPDEAFFRQLYPSRYENKHTVSRKMMEQCTQLPDETLEWAEPILDEILGSTKSYYHIAQAIGDYVRDSAAYDQKTQRMPENTRDFAQWFLMGSDTGYCIHFATAATVLLKAAGIPARYVSGYMVDLTRGKTVVVKGMDAHAWVEYWLPGFGWTILEATPPTASEGPAPGQTQEPEPQVTGPVDARPTPPTETTAPVQTTAPQPSETTLAGIGGAQKGQQKVSADILGVLLWLCLGVLAVLLTVAQWRIRVAICKKRLDRGSVNQRILNRWQRLVRLSRHTKKHPDPALFHTAQKAKFSQYTLTQEELEPYALAMTEAVARLRGRNIFLRLYYTVILALY